MRQAKLLVQTARIGLVARFCAAASALTCCVIDPDRPRPSGVDRPVAVWVGDPSETLAATGNATLRLSDWIIPGHELGRALELRAGSARLSALATWNVTRREVLFVLREPPPSGLRFELRVDPDRLPALSGLPVEVPTSRTASFDAGAQWPSPAAEPAPTFAEIQQIVAPCAECHGTSTAPALTHDWLLEPSSFDPRVMRVDARRPWASRVMHLIVPGYPVDPTPMPPPWAQMEPLDAAEVERIEAWIAAGAPAD